jgi:hypothetical protein
VDSCVSRPPKEGSACGAETPNATAEPSFDEEGRAPWRSVAIIGAPILAGLVSATALGLLLRWRRKKAKVAPVDEDDKLISVANSQDYTTIGSGINGEHKRNASDSE